ncbi:MAG TPA: sulfate adenylyltransferase subunit CysN [Hyphomicrobiales bacterium]|nr:sulfate adenylyltransferase subunit CysN [Hyphomicrobiales bacterium]
MAAWPDPIDFSFERFVAAQENKSLLRFITCGSVDDGKSTLIGRLLYESKLLFDDQLAALDADSRKFGTQAGKLDFALLVDGLAAEREQGITIDVAYRYFTTDRRKFIVADTPGHEQYTRNMATGASTAEVAVILVDARKGLTRQTRRHSLIVSMVGVKHVALAINKMDLVDWSPEIFAQIERDFRAFAAGLGFDGIACIPLSALNGDNVVAGSANAPWYGGPTLLGYLETVEVAPPTAGQPFRLPVQWVNRPDLDFRGYAGLIARGEVRPGMAVVAQPSGQASRVARIVTYGGDLPVAVAGQSVTLTLTDAIDVSRGDVLAAADRPALVAERLDVRLLWMAERPVRPGQSFLMKLGTATAAVTVEAVRSSVDLESLAREPATQLALNAIGDCVLVADRAIAFDPYSANRETGGLILIDRDGYDTVAMGFVNDAATVPAPATAEIAAPAAPPPAEAADQALRWIAATSDRPWRSLAKAVSWRATGSIDTTILAFVFTGNLKVAAAIGGTEVFTKIALYFIHERIWSRLSFGLGPEAKAALKARREGKRQ